MVWCSHCNEECITDRDPEKGYLCCIDCGKILDQDIYTNDPTFEKTSSGQTRLSGSIVQSFESSYSASRYISENRGAEEIDSIERNLNMGGVSSGALAFYKIALDKNFTRGRRTSHVAAACVYIVCRQMKKPYLLIDFSDYLQTNVYVLGAVFLQLCKVLSIDEHPIIQKLVDPSLFIHRFTERLLGERDQAVSDTALRIVASMKRDWMQTGRKPSGLCGAALYISALSHGLNYSKSDIVNIVHICEATLTKRLIEFEETESGSLTIEEFLAKSKELDEESYSNQLPRPGEVLCKHKNTGAAHFAHGLCRKCYNKFNKISGGLHGGAEPPSFQRAERQRVERAKEQEKMRQSDLEIESCETYLGSAHDTREARTSAKGTPDTIGSESLTFERPRIHGEAGISAKGTPDTIGSQSPTIEGPRIDQEEPESTGIYGEELESAGIGGEERESTGIDGEEPESTGIYGEEPESIGIDGEEHESTGFDGEEYENIGIDGEEHESTGFDGEEHESTGCEPVDRFPCNETEELNDTALSEQENFSDIDDDEVDGYLHNEEEKQYKKIIWEVMNREYLEEQAAKEAAAARENGGTDASKPKKERKRRRSDDASDPNQTAAEATYKALDRKGHSSKINYEALGSLFEDQDVGKRPKTDSDSGYAADVKTGAEEENAYDGEYAEYDYDEYYANGGEDYANNEDYNYEY